MSGKRKIGIIGLGPRGGYALECFVLELIKRNSLSRIQFLLFEETGQFGNGQVYNLDQPDSNWININERILELEERKQARTNQLSTPSFPSYHEWRNKDFQNIAEETADTYPPRAKIGEYLQERFQSFIQPLIQAGIAELYTERVVELNINSTEDISIATNDSTFENISEVLLTIGHQPTQLDDQIKKWQEFTEENKNVTLFQSAYPIQDILNHDLLTPESRIGIRGFGLAAIDVIRAVALKFGEFRITDESIQSCQYESTHDLKDLLIPFSLDGLPQAPKPLNAKIDKWFKPTEEQVETFRSLISDPEIQKRANNTYFILNAFAPIASDIYSKLENTQNKVSHSIPEIEESIKAWLKDQSYKHPTILDQSLETKSILQAFTQMATGTGNISLDYCIGQVWRHLQPTIYKALSYNQCSEELVADIVALDESTKRYSFGPPVESIQQLIALVETSALNLELLENPELKLSEKGWQLEKNGQSVTVNIMIDSVLDSPKIEIVNSELVRKMLSNDLIEAVHDKLGVVTDNHGYLISKDDKKLPIALLGRLAKGTIIGVDAILECFGERPQKWASEASNHHERWLNAN